MVVGSIPTSPAKLDGLVVELVDTSDLRSDARKGVWVRVPPGLQINIIMVNIDKEEFIKICNESLCMSEAAQKLNLHFNTFKRYAVKFGCYNPNQGGKGMKGEEPHNKYLLNDILSGKYPNYQTYKLKNKLIQEGIKENKCECCGISEWNGKPINLELHHIDGNSHNHCLNNLQLLCPNCHSQTDNFRAKNIK